ncbi:MAG: NAD-dependent malic enzyme [Candidatus Vogelbacteria bacterium CG10_big_fil_rev_8_21_14_0_10_51_16]|uniref:NAD-dependent malic enzyme n=1 Tax=Candidatus Vogelbacteria bacterium CG10_big_fil_rev_8_21_14_0_10_51_16 TaxID=1975045 RepID=A0A2H0RF63_9BACT|nr:MAG: NAD-dependent malic enzyme [Candidatus Vogelbacteria bacterium CG10_big_fil_rev_8_21_14_0_10_51_16]
MTDSVKKVDLGKASLILHKKARGKIALALKVPIKNRQDLSLAYTPGVAAVSSHLAKHPNEAGLYSCKGNTVAVVSDGSAVLGLGNIGPLGALPVMEGKAALFKRFANVDAFPIVLATQDVDEIVATVKVIAPGFGGINLEDISAPRCFEVERRLKAELDIPVMHDDQHGTAMVVLAGLINACKVTKRKLATSRVVVSGAGAAGTAVAELLHGAGVGDILLLDSIGIIGRHRKDLNGAKSRLLGFTNAGGVSGGLSEAIADADVFIGLSKPGLLTPAHITSMRPKAIVFAMANPVPEIMPDVAEAAGAAVVATGRSDFPNQINNVLGFPGIFRGALDHGVREITEEMLLRAARALARMVARPTARKIIPSPFDAGVAEAVARAIR